MIEQKPLPKDGHPQLEEPRPTSKQISELDQSQDA